MKTILIHLLALTALALTATVASAHEQTVAGPNGGRLLTIVEPHAEFFVTAERKVQITFVGEDGKPVPPAEQVVVVTAGERSAPTKLTFTKTGNVLLSDTALPAGNAFPTVVQIKITPDAKSVAARFTLNTAICPECKNAEYACTCAH
ncbi:hypothetical protein [Rariglobus hedericola]|uniref:Uncharacterized protein n=1 Tax=Rariglobus hedericola TaxID=2597822 RepID=A0A556QL77_9BACT|nr:hypothetical protein [Rariglobus hedericola]TSJ77399.1 hypothetical protein FPL22_15020 [Rariglobus hedericola]